MQLGVVFPTTEIGTDVAAIRDWAQAAEDLGFDYIVTFDHVLGADPGKHALTGPYTDQTQFHEPFVLFGYFAAITQRVQLMTGILILPQRQTALVAKQAAQVDLLSGGRLIVGVGIGWNQVEYEALGQDFRTRGRRVEEQVALLRQLWSQPLLEFDGEFDRVMHAGINPRPTRHIPIWFGGMSDPVLDRIGRIGDGWVADGRGSSRERFRGARARIQASARAAGRDPSEIALGVGVSSEGWPPERQAERAREWAALGATHCSVRTMDAGYTSAAQHIEAMRAFRDAYGRTPAPSTPA